MPRQTLMRLVLALAVLASGAYAVLVLQPVDVAAQEAASRPTLLFQETWQQTDAALGTPMSNHRSDNQYYLADQSAVTNASLELNLYGSRSGDLTVYEHEGRTDLWTGLVGSPVAVTLKHRDSYLDLTGLARVRAIVRTNNLHVLHPVVKLPDGSLLVGSQAIMTDGPFLSSEVAFEGQRWFTLDPDEVSTGGVVTEVDLSRVDEVGFADLAPAGGHGNSGWVNISTFEVYANPVPR
jgi:hypothetical protein